MSPYEGLPPRAFWRTGVADQGGHALPALYVRKFVIAAEDRIATAGSCFAQHIARRLRAAGYAVIDREPPPPRFPAARLSEFGYRQYSARYGNVYTARQLRQLAEEACGERVPAEAVWERDGRFYDALRPSVEPNGLASAEEVLALRANHLGHVAQVFREADVFIFTLGLTETWEHRASGTVYPSAPGVIAGRHDDETFGFRNLTHAETLEDFLAFRALLRSLNPTVRFLLTVSPVPLTATASGQHVLPATLYSKSVLRGVAGELFDRFEDVDYFPSYEIVAGHPSRAAHYETNLRSVSADGVETVMRTFFEQHPPQAQLDDAPRTQKSHEDLVCEEILLEQFAR